MTYATVVLENPMFARIGMMQALHRQTYNNYPPIFAEKKKGPACYYRDADGES
jgi:hypothetical protein